MIQPRAIQTAEDFQAALTEAISQSQPQHVVASVPWSMSLLGLYAFSAIHLPIDDSSSTSDRSQAPLTIAICRNAAMVALNMDILRHSGLAEPAIAHLEPNQMPHEEREVMGWLNHGRVRLLLMTPEAFTHLRFLSILARLNIRLLVVEDAQQLLAPPKEADGYDRLAATLKRFVKLPSVCLLSGPLGANRSIALAEALELPSAVLYRFPTPLASLALHVHTPLTAHQQLSQLLELVVGSSSTKSANQGLRPAAEAGPVIIRVRDPKMAFQIAAMLEEALPSAIPVWQTASLGNSPQTASAPPRQKKLLDIRELRKTFLASDRGILVDGGVPGRLLVPSPHVATHTWIYWELPMSLDHLVMDGLRARSTPTGQPVPAPGSDDLRDPSTLRLTHSHVFYNRERYAEAHARLGNRSPSSLGGQQALALLKDWALADECRLVGLASRLGYPLPGPCGQCDGCQQLANSATPISGFFRRTLKQVLYS